MYNFEILILKTHANIHLHMHGTIAFLFIQNDVQKSSI